MKCANIKCNSEFSQTRKSQKFCCPSCQNAQNQRKYSSAKRRSCIDCGKPVKYLSQRCNSCARHLRDCVTKKTTLKEYHEKLSVKNKHPSWKNSHIRALARHWHKKSLPNSCGVCGYNKHVELAHIKAISDFPETATIGEVNDIKNLIQLCPNCHWESHNGFIEIVNGVPTRTRT